MALFATGKYSWRVCDRCAFRYPYLSLIKEAHGMYVCQTCFDGNAQITTHPQLGPFPVSPDPQGLDQPRPDVVLATTGDAGWQTSVTAAYGGGFTFSVSASAYSP